MIKLRDLLIEGLSPVLYHYTHIEALRNILKQNKMRLSVAFGTKSDFDKNLKKLYFLSLSRIKWGGFARSEFYDKNPSAMVVFDGKKLSNNYKGGSVDYWGREMRTSALQNKDLERYLKNDENEDRLVSDKDEIPNIKKFIKEVHVYVPENLTGRYTGELQDLDKAYKPIYYYRTESAFKLLNKNKATTNLKDLKLDVDDTTPFSDNEEKRELYNITSIINLYNAKNFNNLEKRDNEMMTTIWRTGGSEGMYFSDLKTQIENEIHNYKKDGRYRDQIRELGKIIRKTKFNNVTELIHYLVRKVWKLKESPDKYKELMKFAYPELYKKEFGND